VVPGSKVPQAVNKNSIDKVISIFFISS